MNKLVIPPSPTWYEAAILACAPDNTVLYGSRNSLVVIQPKPYDQPADIKIIPYAHSERITGVTLNHNWGNPSKLAVTIGEDKMVKYWDCEKHQSTASHTTHLQSEVKLIGATFAGNDRVISVSEDGLIVLWRVPNNEITAIKHLLGFKVKVSCISSCPHAPWLTAFGLQSGLVIIADMRKSGKVIYKLRGHDKQVISLAWCPEPINIFPEKKPVHLLAKPATSKLAQIVNEVSKGIVENTKPINEENIDEISPLVHPLIPDKSTEIFIIEKKIEELMDRPKPPVRHNRKSKKVNPWINLKHADDDELPIEPKIDNVEIQEKDFLSECKELLDKIATTKSDEEIKEETVASPDADKDERRILKPKSAKRKSKSSSAGSQIFVEAEEVQADKIEHDCCDKSLPIREMMMEADEKTIIMQNLAKNFDIMYNTAIDILDTKTINEPKEENNSNNIKANVADNVNTTIDSIVPKIEEEIEVKPRKEYLLATSAKGNSIFIWRAGSDGRMQVELRLPGKTRNYGRNWKSDDKTWITLCWIIPNVLLTSSVRGELLKWDLATSSKGPQPTLIHHDHASILFSIAAPIPLTLHADGSQTNWRENSEKSLAAWTMGQDRMLLYTSLDSERKTLACYPTFGGSVLCFSNSPVDPNRIALGVSDGIARIWDLSRLHLQYINMTQIWQKMNSKVLTLAWHPTEEHSLAFGSIEGRVGLINTINLSKTPTLLNQYFRSPIHRLEWGPLNGDVLAPALYVCSEGCLAIYDTKKMGSPMIMKARNEYITQMAWKQDYSLLAIGTKNGCIDLYSTDLQLLKVFYYQKKTIETLTWHPQATAEDSEVSPYENWLAASSTIDHTIVVYDMTNIHPETEENKNANIVFERKAHVKPISNLSWNTYEGGKLASLSEDGVGQVWNIKDGTNIATYVNVNMEPITSGMWSPVNKDLIIIGCKESGIKIVDVTENPPKTEVELNDARKKRPFHAYTKKGKHTSKINDTSDAGEKKPAKDLLLGLVSKNQLETKELLFDCRRLLALRESNNKQNGDSATIGDNNEFSDNVQKTDLLAAKPNDAVINLDGVGNILDLFGTKIDMTRLLDKQIGQHKYHNKYTCVQQLSLWKGDIGDSIKEAIAKGQLSPWLISLAPMVSHKLWLEAVEAYATMLNENPKSCPMETASYYLCCHNVQKAIDVYCSAGLYREALAIAKLRFPTNQQLIDEIVQQWATYSLVNGRFEVAAQCFIVLGQFEEAAKVLFKRSDIESLTLAHELAQKCDNVEMSDAFAFRLGQFHKADAEATSKMDAIIENEKNAEATALPSRMDAIIENEKNAEATALPSRMDAIIENEKNADSTTLPSKIDDVIEHEKKIETATLPSKMGAIIEKEKTSEAITLPSQMDAVIENDKKIEEDNKENLCNV